MRRIIVFLSFIFFANSIFAQKSIHNYKYVIIPEKFEFFKSNDKYQTSSLTKFLFDKYGYTTYFKNVNLPKDFIENNCLALFLDLKDESGMVRTKISIELKDCNNVLVFKSKFGRSKEKDFKKSYQEAIRQAFDDVKKLNYIYKPTIGKKNNTVSTKPKVVKKPTLVIPKNIKKNKIARLAVIKKTEKVPSSNKKKTMKPITLYATPTTFGYQLVDDASKVVFTLLKTEVENVFILKDTNGVLYKKEASWIAEFYKNNM